MYSESEIRFLSTQCQIETAAGPRELKALIDVRTLGCPARIFERVLADRERKMQKAFTEFRASNKSASATTSETVLLDLQIEASRLF
jgi:hypothetical protein